MRLGFSDHDVWEHSKQTSPSVQAAYWTSARTKPANVSLANTSQETKPRVKMEKVYTQHEYPVGWLNRSNHCNSPPQDRPFISFANTLISQNGTETNDILATTTSTIMAKNQNTNLQSVKQPLARYKGPHLWPVLNDNAGLDEVLVPEEWQHWSAIDEGHLHL